MLGLSTKNRGESEGEMIAMIRSTISWESRREKRKGRFISNVCMSNMGASIYQLQQELIVSFRTSNRVSNLEDII